jgi:hypothetical protein
MSKRLELFEEVLDIINNEYVTNMYVSKVDVELTINSLKYTMEDLDYVFDSLVLLGMLYTEKIFVCSQCGSKVTNSPDILLDGLEYCGKCDEHNEYDEEIEYKVKGL